MHASDPEVWRVLYGSSAFTLYERCVLYCCGAVIAQTIPIFIALYMKQWRQRTCARGGSLGTQ